MFEVFVARRYLTAKRKQAVISVITAISILGVAAGVTALIIALAINNGFRGSLQRSLLGMTAHVNIQERQVDEGIADWRSLVSRLRQDPAVQTASASLYGGVFLVSPVQSRECILKGIDGSGEELRRFMKEGSLEALRAGGDDLPGVVLGARLAELTGMRMGTQVELMSPQGTMTPFGPRPRNKRFRVVGIFESGFYELDKMWAFTDLGVAQRFLSLGDVVNAVEVKLRDVEASAAWAAAVEPKLDKKLMAVPWTEQNRQVLTAFKLERVVAVLTIGLIQLVSALNILIALVMMVMEKNRDIAVLVSMGARREQIRKIFLLQGVFIGGVGTVLGLVAGYGLSYLGDAFRWIPLDQELYSLSHVPFEPRWVDALWVSAVAMGVSLLATLYPSRAAARVIPAEALRYE